MSLPRYPGYKDSGVQWLGEVPEHWKVEKLKNALHIKKEVVGKNSADYTLLSLTLQGIIPRDLDNPQGKFPAEFDTYQSVEKNDLVFCLFDVEETPRAVGISDYTGMVTGAYTVCHVEKVNDPKFVYYFYLSRDQYKAFKMYYSGLRNVIRKEVFLSIPFPYPSLDEQSTIATFLDRETGKIDALIAEQEKLLTLLAEKRQATISHAVTKGLNPDVPMKDSGVEWLGEVPAHWDVKRLKNISPQITVGIVVEPSKYYCDDGVPALRSLNVQPGKIFQENFVYISADANNELAKSRLNAGDLVAVRSGQTGTTSVIPLELDGCNCIDLIIIRKPTSNSEYYLSWLLGSDIAIRQFTEGSGGAIQQHFNIGTAMNLIITVPSFEEQLQIVAFLDAETAKLDLLSTESIRAIELLKERRSSLISAAVTGKIDVRQA